MSNLINKILLEAETETLISGTPIAKRYAIGEPFNAVAYSIPTHWSRSKYEKNGLGYNIKIVPFRSLNDKKTFYRNVHHNNRMAPPNQKEESEFDSILRKAMDIIKNKEKQMMLTVKNVCEYQYEFPGAVKEAWLGPTSNTKILVFDQINKKFVFSQSM